MIKAAPDLLEITSATLPGARLDDAFATADAQPVTRSVVVGGHRRGDSALLVPTVVREAVPACSQPFVIVLSVLQV
ncbi:hypothetical protein SK571_40080 [Lentzea sp. BCCO 10_0798]|uniref:UspA domain-containing protein n=1 Tax=Lentzea kristufekii TaxID=3095430 RepID=A0ABU4U4Y5_9PSEU|nr:hypothetical protein [Lentzea sp. BCCO 10_0798]MDX8055612.1 hypothetical protein [Lentzea sp. BCCO 10_0798]